MNIQKTKIFKEAFFMNDLLLERLERSYLEPPEDRRRFVCKCSSCRDSILDGDIVFDLEGENFCESCVDDAHEVASSTCECDLCGKPISEDDSVYRFSDFKACASCVDKARDYADSDF